MGNGIQGDEGNVDAAPRDQFSHDNLSYRKLRSPRLHGQSLQDPPLSSVDQLWQSNLQIRSELSDLEIGEASLSELQKLGRSELVEQATRFSSRYLDVEFKRPVDNIVMAGHQPELFHPGVWYKNFVLSNLGQRFNCLAINLVVDNDICGNASIRFPKFDRTELNDNKVSVGTIPIDGTGPNVPFENREIQDWDLFESFAERAERAICETVNSPIVTQLWPHVLAAALTPGSQHKRLGSAIAAGRHRFEKQVGLNTLEVPISCVAESKAFAIFFRSILINAKRFRSEYNQVLVEYRNIHGIRSRSHPVPELETKSNWTEIPFWVWRVGQPTRRRLFTRQTDNAIWITDLNGWEASIPSDSFFELFRELQESGVAIRPKALMTTMFSRLVLCDLFLHGIGGAKYDQLTDVLAVRFFRARLPGFFTLSATMKLPTDFELVSRSNVVAIDQQIRELKFHPDSHISSPTSAAAELIRQKRDWTVGEHLNERSREKHDAIEALNQQLANFVDVDPESLVIARAESVAKLRSSEILGSREYSFCLFPESLIEELKTMARI